MQLTINGEVFNFSKGKTVSELLIQLNMANRLVAVEHNGNIVPHRTFNQTELTEGDSLEIVTLVGGG